MQRLLLLRWSVIILQKLECIHGILTPRASPYIARSISPVFSRMGVRVALLTYRKVKRGNLERNLEFCTCCSTGLCWRSGTLLVQELYTYANSKPTNIAEFAVVSDAQWNKWPRGKESRGNATTQPRSHPSLNSTLFIWMELMLHNGISSCFFPFLRGGVWQAIPKSFFFWGENFAACMYRSSLAWPDPIPHWGKGLGHSYRIKSHDHNSIRSKQQVH